jgi:hydrogenase maturation protease
VKTLVLGLGNEILADDAVGILAARALKSQCNGQADIIESGLSGLALLELFIGYERAIIIDAVKTINHSPGTIHELIPADLGEVFAPSPHYSGLPELLALAKQLELDFPQEIKIFALEVADPYTIGGDLSGPVKNAFDGFVARIRNQLDIWTKAEGNA